MTNSVEKITPKQVLPGEIIYGNMFFLNYKKEKILVKEQVFSREYEKEMNTIYNKETHSSFYKQNKLKDQTLNLVSIEVLARLGFKNITKN